MNWECLSGDEFPEAVVKASRVCLLPLSCVERHAGHLPLGTDTFIARETCLRAAVVEPAIIFPDLIFTQILEGRHCAGTIALEPNLIIRLLENICSEIARNGMDKIILVNSHGGNGHMLHFFVQSQLASPRNFVLYLAKPALLEGDEPAIRSQWESVIDGHAGENETSQLLVIRPDLVDLSKIPGDDEGQAKSRLKAVRDANLFTGMWWYADHPSHYRGHAKYATAEKGERVLSARARALVEAIRVVKKDNVAKQLQQEFFAAASPATGATAEPAKPGANLV